MTGVCSGFPRRAARVFFGSPAGGKRPGGGRGIEVPGADPSECGRGAPKDPRSWEWLMTGLAFSEEGIFKGQFLRIWMGFPVGWGFSYRFSIWETLLDEFKRKGKPLTRRNRPCITLAGC